MTMTAFLSTLFLWFPARGNYGTIKFNVRGRLRLVLIAGALHHNLQT